MNKIYMSRLVLFFLISALLLTFSPGCQQNDSKEIPSETIEIVAATQSEDSVKAAEEAKDRSYIYLTFDDGPLFGSENVDSVLRAEKVKASVFLVGVHMQRSKQLEGFVKNYEANPYIDLHNHSYSHAYRRYKRFYSDSAGAIADILKNEELFNLQSKIVRLPGRNIWRTNNRKRNDNKSGISTANGLAKAGYKVMGWDLEWNHKPDGTPLQSVSEMLSAVNNYRENKNIFTENNIVVLLHDQMFQGEQGRESLRQFIQGLKAENKYIFEQISAYPK